MIGMMGGGVGAIGMMSALGQSAFGDLQPSQFPGKAKRVIHLFMNGGPFQGDLFDPKPDLLKFAGQRPPEADFRTERKTAGLLPSPFRFRGPDESPPPSAPAAPAA